MIYFVCRNVKQWNWENIEKDKKIYTIYYEIERYRKKRHNNRWRCNRARIYAENGRYANAFSLPRPHTHGILTYPMESSERRAAGMLETNRPSKKKA